MKSRTTSLKLFCAAMVVAATSFAVSNDARAATATFPCGNGQTYTAVNGVITTTSGDCAGALVIDSSVTRIADWVFFNMPITSVTIPDSVTDIGIHAFHVSGQLTTVTIGNGVTRLGGNSFSYSFNLTSITIGNSVQSIEHSTFYNTRITSIVIPKSVKEISTIAFASIPTLRTVTFEDGSAINNSDGSINDTAFQDINGEPDAQVMHVTTVYHCGTAGQRLFDYLVSKGLTPTCTNVPVNTAIPSVSGTAQISETLTSSAGSWSKKTSHVITWQSAVNAGGPYANIGTGSTYVVTASEAGKYIRSSVVATNGNGSSIAATSSATSMIPIPATTTTSPTTTTTTTTPRTVTIEIQAPVTTVAVGQGSIATIAPTNSASSKNTSQSSTTVAKPQATDTTTTSIAVAKKQTNTSPPPSIAQVEPGESALKIDGVTTTPDISRENNQLVISSGPVRASISGVGKDGQATPLDFAGNLRLQTGDLIKINIGGFKADSSVDVWLFSTPVNLGTTTVGPDGKVVATFSVPKNIPKGAHRLAVVAKLPNGKTATFAIGLLFGDIQRTSTLTRILIAVPITLAIAFGLILPTQARRRRRRAAVA